MGSLQRNWDWCWFQVDRGHKCETIKLKWHYNKILGSLINRITNESNFLKYNWVWCAHGWLLVPHAFCELFLNRIALRFVWYSPDIVCRIPLSIWHFRQINQSEERSFDVLKAKEIKTSVLSQATTRMIYTNYRFLPKADSKRSRSKNFNFIAPSERFLPKGVKVKTSILSKPAKDSFEKPIPKAV